MAQVLSKSIPPLSVPLPEGALHASQQASAALPARRGLHPHRAARRPRHHRRPAGDRSSSYLGFKRPRRAARRRVERPRGTPVGRGVLLDQSPNSYARHDHRQAAVDRPGPAPDDRSGPTAQTFCVHDKQGSHNQDFRGTSPPRHRRDLGHLPVVHRMTVDEGRTAPSLGLSAVKSAADCRRGVDGRRQRRPSSRSATRASRTRWRPLGRPRAGLADLARLRPAHRAALFHGTPRFFPDEYIYADSAAPWLTARSTIRGKPAHFPALLEPLLAAPLWALGGVELGYRLVQGCTPLAGFLTAVPVYLLAAAARPLGTGDGSRAQRSRSPPRLSSPRTSRPTRSRCRWRSAPSPPARAALERPTSRAQVAFVVCPAWRRSPGCSTWLFAAFAVGRARRQRAPGSRVFAGTASR